jgi:hypothetical protein
MGKLFIALLLFSFIALPTAFADRTFPTTVRVGDMVQFKYPLMKIGKQVYRLSPGAKIYDQSNRIILPGTVRAKARVAFLTDFSGELSKVWILNPSEVERLKQLIKDKAKSSSQAQGKS